jgi:hypothetical protein
MNHITIPYHLLIPSLISLALFTWIAVKQKKLLRKTKYRRYWVIAEVFLASYTIIVAGAMILELYYQIDLKRYDLNQDGFFSGAEITEAQKLAMLSWTNNIARNFSFLTGLLYSGLISIAFYLIGVIEKLKIKKIITRKTKSK